MTKAYLALGSNLGERQLYLLDALRRIHKLPDCTITAISPVYATKPLGQGTVLPFYNMCIAVETVLSPKALLYKLKEIEKHVGRKDRERWTEREIDIDIILFGDETVDDGKLQIPHPGLLQRDFVLTPLLDLDNNLKYPGTENYLRDSLAGLQQFFIEELLLLYFTILENDIILTYG
ncbi:MAG: 2-amino-4-hydroxy-6-hydroxymethyldihydropteridine diphosphokinase [Ignavibacteriales bacterium]|nr:2-amino-4-hydroxy-6-hydroxymethyldihydropteridine diphosphokinase [Ignavibacteriales bacterium]